VIVENAMRSLLKNSLSLGLASLLLACGDTGQSPVVVPVEAVGVGSSSFALGGRDVSLTRALVGFGPVYFCATAAASSELCPTAQAELRDAVLVDALATAPSALPALEGVSGSIRSASFDYGVTWLAVEQGPTGHVPELGERAARFEGSYERADGSLRAFVFDVAIAPQLRGTQAVQGARTSAELTGASDSLTIEFDPEAWWRDVDPAELDEFTGEPLVIPADSRAHNALVVAMTATRQPRFVWGAP
jgi:hypothetical protein